MELSLFFILVSFLRLLTVPCVSLFIVQISLAAAVRTGNVRLFGEALNAHGEKFHRDHTYTLIQRLHRNVVKTAVRMIAQSYSRIPLREVARKLMLDSPEDAEFIVAKVSQLKQAFEYCLSIRLLGIEEKRPLFNELLQKSCHS